MKGILALVRAGAVPRPRWPEVPGTASDSDQGRDRPVDPVAAVKETGAKLHAQWQRFDESGSARAPWARAYAITTERVAAYVTDGAFEDPFWIADLACSFAALYVDALERYETQPGSAPPAWRVAFAAGDARETLGGQDVLLAMNAHIQRDLPVALHMVGVGAGRRQDFVAVLDVFRAELEGVLAEIQQRYDPLLDVVDDIPYFEPGIVELIRVWREVAWEGATLLARADGTGRNVVMTEIEHYSEAWAKRITLIGFRWLAPLRSWWQRRRRP